MAEQSGHTIPLEERNIKYQGFRQTVLGRMVRYCLYEGSEPSERSIYPIGPDGAGPMSVELGGPVPEQPSVRGTMPPAHAPSLGAGRSCCGHPDRNEGPGSNGVAP